MVNWWTHLPLYEISDSLWTIIYRGISNLEHNVAAHTITYRELLRYNILLIPVCAKSDPRTSNIATGLWERYAIWHSRSTPSPSGNGSALSGTRCYANSPGRSAVNDNNTAAASRQEKHRVQDTRPRAQGNIRRATSVPRLTAKPAHTETMSTIFKRASSRCATILFSVNVMLLAYF